MKYIEINIFHFLLLVIFIYTFTYFWLPKINIKKSVEYTNLVSKYIKLFEEKEYWHNYYLQVNNIQSSIHVGNEASIGSKTSSHSGAITPRYIESNDNNLVDQFFY